MDRHTSLLGTRIGRITMHDRHKARKDDHGNDHRDKDKRDKDKSDKDKPKKDKLKKDTHGGPPAGSPMATFLACAREAIGGVYCTPANEPHCTDCSGLVRRCFRKATQRDIPGDSHEQIKLGAPIPRSDVQPGDLLFWDTMGGTEDRGGNKASHVGISSGENRMLNALNEDLGINESDLSSDYWTNQVTFLGARRLEF